MLEERVAEGFCGYPLCGMPFTRRKGQFVVSNRQVYDAHQLELYCCKNCFVASTYLSSQLSTDPLYIRKLDQKLHLDILAPRLHPTRQPKPTSQPATTPTSQPNSSKPRTQQDIMTNYIDSLIEEMPGLNLETPLVIREKMPEKSEAPVQSVDAIEGHVSTFLIKQDGRQRKTNQPQIKELRKQASKSRFVSNSESLSKEGAALDAAKGQDDSNKGNHDENLYDGENVPGWGRNGAKAPEKMPKLKSVSFADPIDDSNTSLLVTDGEEEGEDSEFETASSEEGWAPSRAPPMKLSLFGKVWTTLSALSTAETKALLSALDEYQVKSGPLSSRKRIFSERIQLAYIRFKPDFQDHEIYLSRFLDSFRYDKLEQNLNSQDENVICIVLLKL